MAARPRRSIALRNAALPAALWAALSLVLPRAARADGVPLGPPPSEAQAHPAVGSDGRGGAIVSWKTASLLVGAVHVNAAGSPDGGFAFGPTSLPVSLEASEPLRCAVPSDSQLLVLADRAAAAAPALTRVRTGGAASPGYPVALAIPLRHAAIVPGLAGRTLLVAKDSDASSYWTLRAAIVGASGQVEFAVQVSSTLQFFNADAIDACTDGAGGLIAAMPFFDWASSSGKDLAVWKVAADGSRPWRDGPRTIVSEAGDQSDVHVAPDGQGGVLLAWTDARAYARSSDIFALHLDANAQQVSGWQFDGTPVCDAPGAQSQPRITPDGGGGAWVVWLDRRASVDGDLRYSHVRGDGSFAPGFTSDGTPLCGAAGAQAEVALAGDGAGGFFAVWRDDRSGTPDLYHQHVLASGLVAAGWPVDGQPLSTAPGVQDQPAIASVAGGTVVIAWRDARDGTARIYAAGVADPTTTAVPGGGRSGLRLTALASGRGLARVLVSLAAPG
ncbi:MAG TPA: hypothetical protein VI504_06645, partial [Candidatus Eisenbacteria bacterium]